MVVVYNSFCMQQDFISALLYHLFSEDQKAHPVSQAHKARFWEVISAAIQRQSNSNDTQTKGE